MNMPTALCPREMWDLLRGDSGTRAFDFRIGVRGGIVASGDSFPSVTVTDRIWPQPDLAMGSTHSPRTGPAGLDEPRPT